MGNNGRYVQSWTDWDYIDWFNNQVYSAHYDAWCDHQSKMMDYEPTEEEIGEANAHMLKRLGMEYWEVE